MRSASFIVGIALLGSITAASTAEQPAKVEPVKTEQPKTEPIKLSLRDFVWKCNFDGGTELGGYDEADSRFFLYTHGNASGDVTIPADGEYTITVKASCVMADKQLAKFKLTVGDTVVAKEHACTTEDPKEYVLTAKLKQGKQKLAVEFLNDVYKDGEYDLNLYLNAITVAPKK